MTNNDGNRELPKRVQWSRVEATVLRLLEPRFLSFPFHRRAQGSLTVLARDRVHRDGAMIKANMR